MGVLEGGLGVAVVALAVVVVVLATGGSDDSTTSTDTSAAGIEPDCGVVEGGGPARLDLTQSGLDCEEGRAVQLALVAKSKAGAAGAIEVGAWRCSREPLAEYPVLTLCRSGEGRELAVVGTAPSAHLTPAEQEAGAATESTRKGNEDQDSVAFEVPSGNITCALSRESVHCEIFRKRYTPYISKPPSCNLDYGHRVGVAAYGAAEFDCYGDSMRGIAEGTLGYGREIRRGRISCLSEEDGLTCETVAGTGFFLSVDAARLL